MLIAFMFVPVYFSFLVDEMLLRLERDVNVMSNQIENENQKLRHEMEINETIIRKSNIIISKFEEDQKSNTIDLDMNREVKRQITEMTERFNAARSSFEEAQKKWITNIEDHRIQSERIRRYMQYQWPLLFLSLMFGAYGVYFTFTGFSSWQRLIQTPMDKLLAAQVAVAQEKPKPRVRPRLRSF